MAGAEPSEGKCRRARVNVWQCLKAVWLCCYPSTQQEEKRRRKTLPKLHHRQSKSWLLNQINRADRWSPVVPHPHENPFPFLVCQSHSLPLSELVSHCALHRRFSSSADSTIHSQEFSQARTSSHQPVCLSSPFICCLFSIHTQRIHPLARPFACSARGDSDANVRKCILSNCATRFFTSGLFTLYLVLPYSDFGPEISSKGKSKFKSCRCACE